MTIPAIVTIGSIGLTFIQKMERRMKKDSFKPKWVNQTEAVDTYWYNVHLVEIEYSIKATDAEKWGLDQLLRAHSKVPYGDYVDNLFSTNGGGVWVSKIEAKYSSNNYTYPWEITIIILAMSSELEGHNAIVMFDSLSLAYPVVDNRLGEFLIDGTDDYILVGSAEEPILDTLTFGMHDVNFTPPLTTIPPQRFVKWIIAGDIAITDESDSDIGASCTIFVYGNGGIMAVYEPYDFNIESLLYGMDILLHPSVPTKSYGLDIITVGTLEEVIINGGFEINNGAFTTLGWTPNALVQSIPHTGSYSCLLYESGYYQTTMYSIPVTSIDSFSIWFKMQYGGHDILAGVIVYYDDLTSRWIHLDNYYTDGSWTQVDLKAALIAAGDSAKTIQYISIRGGTANPMLVDDLSLKAYV